jgi:hypothetical protein
LANIDRIANVQISLKTAPVFQVGFNVALVAGPHVKSLNRVDTVTSSDDLLTMGLLATDPLYVAVNDAFSQIPKPRLVKVGRRQVDTVTLTPTVVSGRDYVVTIGYKNVSSEVIKTDYTFTSDVDATAAEICAGLQGLIDADTACPVDAAVAGSTVTLTNKVPGVAFSVTVNSLIALTQPVAVATVTDDMTAINNEDSDWYGFGITSRVSADIIAAADWTESKIKLFGYSTAEAGAKDNSSTTDTMSKLRDGNYFRTFGFYHGAAATDYPELGVMTKCFAINPGGDDWANRQLGGIIVDKLNETEYLAVTAKNGNTFEPLRNVSITQNGKVAAGEWIDTIRFRDWLQEEMQVRIFSLLVNNNKVPYTDGGIAQVENAMRGALLQGQDRGGIAPTEFFEDGTANPGFVVSVPLSSNISSNDKANRVLNDMNFTARLAGAIHVVNVSGSLTYQNLV